MVLNTNRTVCQAFPVTTLAPVRNPTLKYETRYWSDQVPSIGLCAVSDSDTYPTTPTTLPKSGLLALRTSNFLRFPSRPLPRLASNALAIQIAFPSVGVTPPSLRRMDLPASQSKQKASPIKLTFQLERETRFELATSTLARLRSTN